MNWNNGRLVVLQFDVRKALACRSFGDKLKFVGHLFRTSLIDPEAFVLTSLIDPEAFVLPSGNRRQQQLALSIGAVSTIDL
jgi:hypothetical protein